VRAGGGKSLVKVYNDRSQAEQMCVSVMHVPRSKFLKCGVKHACEAVRKGLLLACLFTYDNDTSPAPFQNLIKTFWLQRA